MTAFPDEREGLVAALRKRGVDYLAPGDAREEHPLDDEALLARLATHSDPRLRQALIALFLLHPELAPAVASVRRKLATASARDLVFAYMAAVYLQRMWSIRLSRLLKDYRELPDLHSRELGLPEAAEEHGKVGLHRLAELQASHSPWKCNHLSEYEGVADLLMQSLKMRRKLHESATKR